MPTNLDSLKPFFYPVPYSQKILSLFKRNLFMKVGVTAANGKLASAIIHKLLQELSSDEIVGLARKPAKAAGLGVEIRPGDYDEKSHFDAAFKDIDVVILISGMDQPDKRIGQHRNVINAARDAGVKKIVYTSIIGASSGTSFSPIVVSNHQTEDYIRASSMQWAIGRNGLYIEPDVEYLDNYIKAGKITNCAGEGKCAYTTRNELAHAYTQMALLDKHNDKTYVLAGEPITQKQLADLFNTTFGLSLEYESIPVEAYKQERTAELGEFLGTIISGIYAGIRDGSFDVQSDYEAAAGRRHMSWKEYFKQLADK
jgi:NAD(P)H dehydrogenase (quinone)